MCCFQGFSALNQDTVLSSNSCANHHSCGRGKAQRTWAGNGENSDARLEREGHYKLDSVVFTWLYRREQRQRISKGAGEGREKDCGCGRLAI